MNLLRKIEIALMRPSRGTLTATEAKAIRKYKSKRLGSAAARKQVRAHGKSVKKRHRKLVKKRQKAIRPSTAAERAAFARFFK